MTDALTWLGIAALWVGAFIFLAWQSDKRGIGFLFAVLGAGWLLSKVVPFPL